jgi:membrane protease YdiL (CAAX protease family)
LHTVPNNPAPQGINLPINKVQCDYTAAEAVCQKEQGIGIFFEPLILYFVLFLPGLSFNTLLSTSAESVPAVISFSVNQELTRIVVYNIPALALVWYLLFITRSLPREPGGTGEPRIPRPEPGDLKTLLLGFPALVLLGFFLSLVSSFIPELPAVPDLEGPQNVLAIAVMVLSCFSTGYLEESYFRFYLFTRFQQAGLGLIKGMVISSALFALCHIYEGPLGALNAFLAGLILYLLMNRRRAIHGLAWAHGLYNVFVYVMAFVSVGQFP